MVITSMLRNIKDTGYPMRARIWKLFTPDIILLAVSDLMMVLTCAPILPMQKMFKSSKGVLRWKNGGLIIQTFYQLAWLSFWVR
jgi:sterol O-acyltransferase